MLPVERKVEVVVCIETKWHGHKILDQTMNKVNKNNKINTNNKNNPVDRVMSLTPTTIATYAI